MDKRDMMNTLITTGNIVQSTPQEFFDRLNAIFRFTLDVCALPENAKCSNYYTPEDDGLLQPWGGGVWCNPPFGKEIVHWVKKASEEYLEPHNDFIVMLLPGRCDTRWFHDYVYGKATLFFVDGRLQFGDHGQKAPFPIVIALYMKKFGGKNG